MSTNLSVVPARCRVTRIAPGNLVEDQLSPRGVGVLLVAEHTCMTLRGARAPGSATTTSSLRGHLRENAAARAEFLALVNGGVR